MPSTTHNEKVTLLITGGAGRIGTALRPLLRSTYVLRLLDVRPLPSPLVEDEQFVHADASDLDAMVAAMRGADAVLHLAGNPAVSSAWTDVRTANVEATYCVFEAARQVGANKVVFASTNHVMGFYDMEGTYPIRVGDDIRPDSLYGVSKAFGEALARYFADAHGMSMICLRIGWFTPNEPNVVRLQPLWISARDMAQVVRLSVETSRRFGIYNATSNNSQREWDLSRTRDELGYAPEDDVTQLGLGDPTRN